MLALTRKKGESLVVNNNIEITVLEIRGDQVKIGFFAHKINTGAAFFCLYNRMHAPRSFYYCELCAPVFFRADLLRMRSHQY